LGPTDGQPFSLVGVPIKDGDTVVGTLTIDRVFSDRSAIRFDHDVRFLTMIANLVGKHYGCISLSRATATG